MSSVSVLLRTLNAESYLGPLLESLKRQTLPPIEVLIVDSGSTDRTIEMGEAAGARIETILPEEFTHAYSTNYGFRAAKGELVAMLSQDALPANENWLEALATPHKDQSVGATFGRQVAREGCFPLERWEIERCYPSDSPAPVVYSNVSSLAKKSLWEQCPFDESLRISEDQVWAENVLESGYKVLYIPESHVWHSHTYTLRGVYDRCRAEARARLQADGVRESHGLLWKGWPKQAMLDAHRLIREGSLASVPRAWAYRFAQFAGMVNGGKS
ncbi:MAG: glycosyltransferase family 2 protein [Candidatus Eisenbacteria bacterium]|uniref:Glycosyltransferase family 2 protein n=1 Tax=Eiseniibacteriota bacterium TaxID=2212470 RepID=A0A7Y2EDQ3_UNCEI|nr:glycosyltransferase family 2 protein [Candidatus Eisenbacteria bacterium]